jgi:hypothetical protein
MAEPNWLSALVFEALRYASCERREGTAAAEGCCPVFLIVEGWLRAISG